MTSAPYLEQYLESLTNLPIELQRNFNLMRQLDSTTQELMRSIDLMADDYISNANGNTEDKNKETMTIIQRQFGKAKEYGDDKVQLAIQTYELVDKHIRKLDLHLERFEREIKDRAISATGNIEQATQTRGRKTINVKEIINKFASGVVKATSAAPNKKSTVSAVANTANPINSVSSVSVEIGSLTDALAGAGIAHSAEVLDMPVDPNEPTYCLCNQVSFGEMIGCDNSECPIEWFHFACVKLKTKPKGKWFCPKCVPEKKKK